MLYFEQGFKIREATVTAFTKTDFTVSRLPVTEAREILLRSTPAVFFPIEEQFYLQPVFSIRYQNIEDSEILYFMGCFGTREGQGISLGELPRDITAYRGEVKRENGTFWVSSFLGFSRQTIDGVEIFSVTDGRKNIHISDTESMKNLIREWNNHGNWLKTLETLRKRESLSSAESAIIDDWKNLIEGSEQA